MFVVDATTLVDSRDDRGEVVVGEDHVGGFLADVRAGDAHGHADVGAAQCRGVVHAVTGHRDDRALRSPGVDDAQLLLGVRPSVDADIDRRDAANVASSIAASSSPVRLVPVVAKHADAVGRWPPR